MLYIYPYTINVLEMTEEERAEAPEDGRIAITEEDYQLLLDSYKIWENGVLIENTHRDADIAQVQKNLQINQINKEIAQLKQELTDLDYKTIKFIQGKLTAEEFNTVTNICEEKRNRINELEAQKQEIIGG